MNRPLAYKVWWSVVGLVNAVPLVIWLLMAPLAERFGGGWQIMTSLGQLSALLGFSLLATTIILTSRLGPLERWARGLNRIFINHHRLGGVSFILLLLHPLLLAARFITTSWPAVFSFLWPTPTDASLVFGWASLVLMIILLVITFYLGWRYQWWKFSHRFLALAFILAVVHLALVDSDVSENMILRFYLLFLSALTLIAYAYRLLVEFFDWGKHEYLVTDVRPLAGGVTELKLQPRSKPFSYHAGQFAFLRVRQKGLSREEHPFSFVSAPSDEILRFGIKDLGDYTKTLAELKTGSRVYIEGPYGNFGHTHDLDDSQQEIWIAGGIGITPFVSLARYLVDEPKRSATLYYSLRGLGEGAYLEELEDLARQASNFRLVPYYSSESVLLTAEKIVKDFGPLDKTPIYICGPASMMSALKEQFINLGVDKKNIHTEEFSL